MNLNMRRSRRRKAFTLIEVLLVLAILVILGSIVIVNFSNVFENSKAKAAQAQLDALETQLDLYKLDVGTYPNTSQGLAALRQAPAEVTNVGKWSGPYAQKDIPNDPWGNPYQYQSTGAAFTIWSLGPDGQDGTDDDIRNVTG